jgi:ParB-like chromosome segregation protein Spo0J
MGIQVGQIGEVAVADLCVEPELQPRVSGVDPEHVAALAETSESWPPLVVIRRGGQLVVIDGAHRLKAAQQLGLQAIRVEVRDAPAENDLRGLAFSLNLRHGRPLTLDDRRAEAIRLLRIDPARSSRSIGRDCGLSHVTVERLRSGAEQSGQIDHLDRREGDRGYSYRAPARKLGELPNQSAGDLIGSAIAGVVGRKEVVQRRRAASYLRRVSEALSDQFELADYSPEALAAAAGAQFGADETAALADALGAGTLNLYRVACLIGCDRDAEVE